MTYPPLIVDVLTFVFLFITMSLTSGLKTYYDLAIYFSSKLLMSVLSSS